VTRGKYYSDKRCTNMGGSKNAKKPNEKKKIIYNIQRTKVHKLGCPKNDRFEKT
jgi:hypothetical protein